MSPALYLCGSVQHLQQISTRLLSLWMIFFWLGSTLLWRHAVQHQRYRSVIRAAHRQHLFKFWFRRRRATCSREAATSFSAYAATWLCSCRLQRQLFGGSFGTPSATAQALFSDSTATSATCFEQQQQQSLEFQHRRHRRHQRYRKISNIGDFGDIGDVMHCWRRAAEARRRHRRRRLQSSGCSFYWRLHGGSSRFISRLRCSNCSST